MIHLQQDNLSSITKVLIKGGVIALPTDTIYGLVCQANNKAAISNIYQIKHRSNKKPLAILVNDWQQANEIGIFNQELVTYLENNFLPGKVTVIVNKRNGIFNDNEYWHQWKTVAIRVTHAPLVNSIIEILGPLVATSCNISSEPEINDSQAIKLPLLEYVVDGSIFGSKPSTIYDSINKKIIRK